MTDKAEEVEPDPGSLVESLRDFGYTLPSALADLVDNSLAAGAKNISVEIHAERESPYIAVFDDGGGMDEARLVEAMRMGGSGPAQSRNQGDLGRFGLGLKTASLSQGKTVTVITRTKGGTPSVRKWDIPYIQSTKEWRLTKELSSAAQVYAEKIEALYSGTAVIIENLDRPAFLRVSPAEVGQHVGRALEIVRHHLSMVFHRFIEEDGVVLRLGPSPVPAWDPFLRDKSTSLPPEQLLFAGAMIGVTPYILPHYSKLTDEEHDAAAGPNGWNAHQGFYVYRCRRLIVPGTWLNLQLRKDEHFKLARIALDLPNSVDEAWHLNVMKSHVAAPTLLRDDFKRIAADVRRQAAAVYRHRGQRALPQNAAPERFVWKRHNVRGGVRYGVDRSHPVIRALLHGGCDHAKVLDTVLRLIESTVPIANMLQEPSKTLDGAIEAMSAEDLANLADAVVHAEQFLIRAGSSPKTAREKVLSSEPFARHRQAILEQLS